MADEIRRSEAVSGLAFEDVAIQTSPDFNSKNPNHRALIRAAIETFIESEIARLGLPRPREVEVAIANLSTLALRPAVPGWAVSISHCEHLGGFLATPSESSFGLDFELASRVSEKIATRVAAFAGEVQILKALAAAEEPMAIFWAAKESAIKAFGNRHPLAAPHFGEVEITSIDLAKRKFLARRNGELATGELLPMAARFNQLVVAAAAKACALQ